VKYLDLINNFWSQNQVKQFTTTETALYFAILNIANNLRWKESAISVASSTLAGMINVSRQTLINARKSLAEKGMISFVQGERRKCAAKYTIIPPSFSPNFGHKEENADGLCKEIRPKIGQNPLHKTENDEILCQGLCLKSDPYKREDKRKDLNHKRREDKTVAGAKIFGAEIDPKKEPIPYDEIGKLFNSICSSLKTVRGITETRKKHIRARWKELDSLEKWKGFFAAVESSKFLTGNNDRGWQASFDWLLSEQNMTKVLEGRYEDRKKKGEVTQFDLVRGPVWEKQAEVELDDFAILEEVLREDGEPERE